MPRIHVLIADSKRVDGSDRCDILAAGIEAAVKADAALELAGVVGLRQVEEGVDDIPPAEACAVVLTGDFSETDGVATRALARRERLAVLQVTLQADVRMSLRAVDMPTFLSVLSSLAGRVIPSSSQLRTRVGVVTTRRGGHEKGEDRPSRPLLEAAQRWIHAVLLAAVQRLAAGKDAVPGITIAPASLAERMDAGIVGETVKPASMPAQSVEQVDAALDAALAEADDEMEPLARVAAIAGLTRVEFRILLLALAPELDPRYQSCYGLLLDDLGRRAGTLALYSSLIGNASEIHALLARSGNLARWRLLEGPGARLPRADEPLRVDASLGAWLMGDDSALAGDAHVSRVLRLAPWAGARLFVGEHERAARLVAQLHEAADPHWLVLAHGDAAGWRALLEVGAELLDAPLIRVQAGRVPGTDVSDIHECGARLGRFARLTDRPLVIDAAGIEATPLHDDALRMLCTAISGTGCRAAIVCDDATRTLGLLGAVRCTLHEQPAMTPESRTAAVESAARRIGIALEPGAATAVTRRFPLDAERLERVMRLAVVRIARDDDEAARLERFQATMREVAAEGLSGLADRVEPVFELSDVVLPADRSRQLEEIVYSVRLAPRVLDDWKFGERLPYGRGVAALFHGSSGTGKTMAAHGIARKLGVELLRFDLSRTVSKYIGETEKNIDRVFDDAERSGAAILIDEADALLGKRSEVKDAHDRYANIEVAYLLQRMEAYEGLAILTSNLRQNIDAAFLRRLRFVVEFPRPDVDAREKIWRRCLPLVAHDLDDSAFRLLARRIDLTGGHIVQIALRAAFAAAAEGVRIRLTHLQYASRAEFAKLGMPAVELEPSRNLQAA